jgi:hypothetical protein
MMDMSPRRRPGPKFCALDWAPAFAGATVLESGLAMKARYGTDI